MTDTNSPRPSTPAQDARARELTETLARIVDWESVGASETFSEAAYTHIAAALATAEAPLREQVDFLKGELAQLAHFNPDWDMLAATRDSLRECQQLLADARGPAPQVGQGDTVFVRDVETIYELSRASVLAALASPSPDLTRGQTRRQLS